MMLPAGNLFHIDFGFILGLDPKPLPPPFRFTTEMCDAMGGTEGEDYQKFVLLMKINMLYLFLFFNAYVCSWFYRFRSKCCQAYNILRKEASLIINLLSLMVDAGIEGLSIAQDPARAIKNVQDKFRLNLTDEQAENFFLGLINDSLNALAPKVMEWAHKISVARR